MKYRIFATQQCPCCSLGRMGSNAVAGVSSPSADEANTESFVRRGETLRTQKIAALFRLSTTLPIPPSPPHTLRQVCTRSHEGGRSGKLRVRPPSTPSLLPAATQASSAFQPPPPRCPATTSRASRRRLRAAGWSVYSRQEKRPSRRWRERRNERRRGKLRGRMAGSAESGGGWRVWCEIGRRRR